MKNHRRNVAPLGAASAILAGLGLALWAWFGMQPQVPRQDVPVVVAGSVSNAAQVKLSTKPADAFYAKRPRYASKVGTITMPTLHLSWPIYEGTTAAQLARGVGHFRQSVLPGEHDNSVLSGHRSSVFNRLGELRKGSLIYVKTVAGTFTYRVRAFRVVKRTNRSVIVPTKNAVLTLTTCWPFNHIGTTTQAFVVSADLVASKLAMR